MHTLPTPMIQVLAPFAPLFSKSVFQHVQLLLVGAILAPGKRTVASALRAVSLEDERRFCRYHRVLNRAVWSSREASRVLLGLLVEAFVPEGGPLVLSRPSGSGRRRRRSGELLQRCWGCVLAGEATGSPAHGPEGAQIVRKAELGTTRLTRHSPMLWRW